MDSGTSPPPKKRRETTSTGCKNERPSVEVRKKSFYQRLFLQNSFEALKEFAQREVDRLGWLLIAEQLQAYTKSSIEELVMRLLDLSVISDETISDDDSKAPCSTSMPDLEQLATLSRVEIGRAMLSIKWSFDDLLTFIEKLNMEWCNACATDFGLGQTHTQVERDNATVVLRRKPRWIDWGLEDVMPLINLLRRAPAVEGRGKDEWAEQFQLFLRQHQGIAAYLDPFLVVVENGGAAPLLPVNVGAAPPPVAVGWTHALNAATSERACQWAAAWREAGAPRTLSLTYAAGSLRLL